MSFTLPKDFTVRMQEMLGDEYSDFLHSYENANYQALRINRLKGDINSFQSVCGFADSLTPVTWTCDGFYYPDRLRPGKHPYHEAGVYYIQEPSAMMPAALLDAQPGEKILDLCAAPGGKSTQIASAMQQKGLLISNEIHPARARILSENMERMGIRNAIVTNESPQTLAPRFPSYFDRIMVDAPCSGEGMFRKNEEAVSQWSVENVRICADRQDEILDCAHRMLRPGGTMVYSTCTFAPDENEGSISRFLLRHPEYEIIEQTRLWPHKIKGEGHFVAVLCKKSFSGSDEKASSVVPGKSDFCLRDNRIESSSFSGRKKGKQKQPDGTDLKELQNFLNDTLRLPLTGRIECFGDQIYLLPEETPSLGGLRVLRAGLHLGTMLKNRFEPSHALALTLSPEDVASSVSLHSNLPDEYRIACDYIGGQTFSLEGRKGWHLICLDSYSLGWGKLAGGIVKNHYPKGLRKNL
ncbi:MAG: RsmB/NOP family class I SAM-dependent RNA methyltransferase [Lachnospiraceae bacterium]|nr:RsmB/NOP family class I SAM-dependent RNA methyltransferase [Lachnospiraceae bacterium]